MSLMLQKRFLKIYQNEHVIPNNVTNLSIY